MVLLKAFTMMVLVTTTTAMAQAAPKVLMSCSSKYEKFEISADDKGQVTLKRATWLRGQGATATQQIEFDFVKEVSSNGKKITLKTDDGLREPGTVTVVFEPSSDINEAMKEVQISGDNKSVIDGISDALSLSASRIVFESSECTISK